MPKQVLQLTNFSGGLNAYSTPRDIDDTQFVQNWNAVVTKNGILRVGGAFSLENGIKTEYHDNANFEPGFGLFQFSADYSLSKIQSNFNTGIATGTIATYSSTSSFTLEDKPGTSSTNDAYNGLHLFIYSGTGIGESRKITDYVGSSRTVTCEAFDTTLHDKDDGTPSKYIIYNWKSSNGWTSNGTGTRDEDAFTNGFNADMHESISTEQSDDYYTVCQKSTILDEQSKNFGNIEYGSSLSLTPGVEYTLSFDCAAKHAWYNLVSKGYVAGIADSGIDSDNTSGSTLTPTTDSVTLPVDGTLGADLAAMKAKILDRKVYLDDGTFIGLCTSVLFSSSSDGAVVFGNGIETNLINNKDLYVGGHGDKVPWVELYSTTVADTKGSIKSISSNSVSTTGSWENDATYYNVSPFSSKGAGRGAEFNIVTTSSGGTATFHFTNNRGTRYAVGDKLRFKDPDGSGNFADITVGAINITGLSLTASEDTNISSWKSGIAGNGQTSEYLKKTESNYISSGDFTEFNDDSAWTVVTGATASEADTFGARYDGHDGTLLLSRTSGNIINPAANSWNGFIYQDLTLSENTLYHLNFLYDSYGGQNGITYTVYDTTNSTYLIEPQFLGDTRNAFVDDDSTVGTNVNYRYGGQQVSGGYVNDLNKMNYIPFKVGSSPTNADSGEATCSIRIAFARTDSSDTESIRLGMVSVYKAYNDLVTMNYKSPIEISGNPYSDNIESFSKYSVKFKIPENYSSVSDWTLKLYGGQYSFRTSNSITTLGVSGENSQEVYFDNIKLSDNSSDVITLLSNNDSEYSDISFYSQKSSFWENNIIRWNGLNSKPSFDYINGMLKISDGNFNNSNNNKLMYYAKKDDSYGTGKLGWVVKDKAIQDPPTISVASTNINGILNQYIDCVSRLNQRYIQEIDSGNGNMIQIKLCGDYNSDSNAQNVRNAGQVASAFGSNDIQGFVTRYWFDSRHSEHDANSIFDDSFGGKQVMIPRFDVGESNQVSQWYLNNVLNQGTPFIAGGYESDSQTLPTGTINNENYPLPPGDNVEIHTSDYINFHRVGIKDVNSTSLDDNISNPTWKDVGIPSEIIQEINSLSDNAGDVAKIDIEFEYEMLGQGGSELSTAERAGPYFTLEIGKPSDINNTDSELDEINVNYTSAVIDVIAERNYGNGCSPPTTENIVDISKDDYNTPEDDGICENKVYEQYTNRSRLNLTFSDSISFNKEEITKDDRILFRIKEYPVKESGTSFSSHWSSNNWYWNFGDEAHEANMFSSPGNKAVSFFTRFKINKINISYFNKEAEISEEETLSDLNNTDAKVLFQWGSSLDEGSLSWGERSFRIASSSVNIFNEESALSELPDIIGGIGEPTDEFPDGLPVISLGYAPEITVRLSHSHFNDSYTSKTKFYMKDENSDIWYLQFYIDHKTGTMHSTTSGIKANKSHNTSLGVFDWTLERESFLNFNEVNSYESESMISQEDAFDTSNLTCRYKTSVVANNKLYVGNIMQKGRVYSDRMLKSPIGKYNLLPKSNFIDVAINDGDEITALAYYKDKILQFKKRKIFIINISGDYEFLEDTFDNVGVSMQASVTKTPYGIVWVNESGCYLYDGANMVNLIDNVIPVESHDADISNNYWYVKTVNEAYETASSLTEVDAAPIVSYFQNKDTLLVKWSVYNQAVVSAPDAASYHFPTKSWVLHHRIIYDNLASNTGEVSNMITDSDGNILTYNKYSESSTPAYDGIKKWEDKPLTRYNNIDYVSGSGVTKLFTFTTKDFTFGNILNRKKIYKVYITYKTTDGSNSKVIVKAAKDGGSKNTAFNADTSKFAGTSTACYHDSNGLLDTGGDWKVAELKFSTPSDYNNIYSFQLRLESTTIDINFEVNDISIIYKTKRLK